MKQMLTNNLGLKLLSMVFAVMLWLIVVNIDDPVISQEFPAIRVTMLNEDAVTGKDKVYKIEDNSDVINVRVQAKRSIISKLSVSDFTATADMEKNIKFGNLVGIDVTCSNKNIKAADITKSRENVVISVEDASAEQFNVVVNQLDETGSGYVVGTAVPEQNLIRISGPASVIAKIKRVVVDIKVDGATSNRVVKGKLRVLNSDGDELDTTYLEYNGKEDGMDVQVTILRTKEVPLRIGWSGVPGDGYSFDSISCKPEVIEIAGTPEDIAKMRALVVPDEAVDISGITSNMQLSLDITEYLPAGIRLKDSADATVVVVVELEKKQGKTVRIPVSKIGLQNIPRGLEADFGEQKEVEFIVMGTSAELAELDVNEIAVSLDLEEFSKTGTYTKKLNVVLPGTYTLMEDVEIEFELVKATGNTNNGTTGSNTTGSNTTGNNTTGNNNGTANNNGGTGDTENSGTAGNTGGTGTSDRENGTEKEDTGSSSGEHTENKPEATE